MKIEQAIMQSQIEINRTINPQIAIAYLNNIQLRLAVNYETARNKESFIIENEDTNKYYPLKDYVDSPIKVESVKFAEGLKRFKNYEVEDKEIRFLERGKFKVKAQKMPKLNRDKTEEINLPEEYHVAISKWISHKELSKLFGANNNDASIKEEEFWVMVNEIDSNLKRLDKKPKTIKVPRW